MEGVVKFFDAKHHYGFLYLTDESGDVVSEHFFSGNDVIGEFPAKGDRVNFLLDDPPSRAQRRDLIATGVEKVTRCTTVTYSPSVIEKDRADEREEVAYR